MRVFNAVYTALQLGKINLILRVYKFMKEDKR